MCLSTDGVAQVYKLATITVMSIDRIPSSTPSPEKMGLWKAIKQYSAVRKPKTPEEEDDEKTEEHLRNLERKIRREINDGYDRREEVSRLKAEREAFERKKENRKKYH